MARLKGLALLILIASALRLSVASGETAKPEPKALNTPEPNVTEHSQQTKTTQTKETSATLSPPISTQNQTPSHPKDKGDSSERIEKETADYTGLLVIVGLAAAVATVLNYCAAKSAAEAAHSSAETAKSQLEFTKLANEQNSKMTSDALEAAKQHAEAARIAAEANRLALDIHRPFLLVTSIPNSRVTHDGSTATIHHNFEFSIEIKNFGSSPADIIDCVAEAELFEPPHLPQRGDPAVWYGPNDGHRINDSVVSPGQSVSDRIQAYISVNDSEYKALRGEEKRIGIHGRIRYRGASPTTFDTFFFWWCFNYPDASLRAIGNFDEPFQFARALTKKLNDHT